MMCMEPRNRAMLKERIEVEQQELEQAVHDGDTLLCEHIQCFIKKHLKGLHIFPSDGRNNI